MDIKLHGLALVILVFSVPTNGIPENYFSDSVFEGVCPNVSVIQNFNRQQVSGENQAPPSMIWEKWVTYIWFNKSSIKVVHPYRLFWTTLTTATKSSTTQWSFPQTISFLIYHHTEITRKVENFHWLNSYRLRSVGNFALVVTCCEAH